MLQHKIYFLCKWCVTAPECLIKSIPGILSRRRPHIFRWSRGTDWSTFTETWRPRADQLADALRCWPGLHRQSESLLLLWGSLLSNITQWRRQIAFLFFTLWWLFPCFHNVTQCCATRINPRKEQIHFMHFVSADTEWRVHAERHSPRCNERRSEEFKTEVVNFHSVVSRWLVTVSLLYQYSAATLHAESHI